MTVCVGSYYHGDLSAAYLAGELIFRRANGDRVRI